MSSEIHARHTSDWFSHPRRHHIDPRQANRSYACGLAAGSTFENVNPFRLAPRIMVI